MDGRKHAVVAMMQAARDEQERHLRRAPLEGSIYARRSQIERAMLLMRCEGFCAVKFDITPPDSSVGTVYCLCVLPAGHDGPHARQQDDE